MNAIKNAFNVNVTDALSAWDNVKEHIKVLSSNSQNERQDLDYSYITPSLLAVARFGDDKVNELRQILQGNAVMFWNLSGKPCPNSALNLLNNQILDCDWESPGEFTQAPSLECLFVLSHSIKTWLDLNSNHVAIVHCANGRSRTGILIACLLREMNVFEQTSRAFDYFCSARSQLSVKPTLAPSYQILFENIDKVIQENGYPNRNPLHLNSIAISGLPVDAKPCIEIFDCGGQIYSSHSKSRNANKSTWNADFGDGFFRVNLDILGDFSIICRFGGDHANKRDKTTLIFKYQNNTAFLPCEVVELKRHNVDVNPEYSESLDCDVFTVHMVFEKVRSECISKKLPSRDFTGLFSFDEGIDEISKIHNVFPILAHSEALVDRGFSPRYANVALQLSNNNITVASSLLDNMTARVAELNRNFSKSNKVTKTDSVSPKNGKKSVGLTLVPSVDPPECSEHCNAVSEDKIEICHICNIDNLIDRDQLVKCNGCSKYFHAVCAGGKRIPFGVKTSREKQNRYKYISKTFAGWKCPPCSGSLIPTRRPVDKLPISKPVTNESDLKLKDLRNFDQQLVPRVSKNGEVSYRPYAEFKNELSHESGVLETSSEGAANSKDSTLLIGILAASGITLESLANMSESRQIDALVAATNHYNSKVLFTNSTTINKAASPMQSNETKSTISAIEATYSASTYPSADVASSHSSIEVIASPFAINTSSTSTILHPDHTLGNNQASSSSSKATAKKLKDDTCLAKYFTMVKVGAGKIAVAAKMANDNIVSSAEIGQLLLDLDPETEYIRSPHRPNEITIRAVEHPKLNLYFRMLKAGAPELGIKKKMELDCINPLFLSKRHDDFVPISLLEEEVIAVCDHPVYSKYFKMLKIGLARDQVKNKMTKDGVDPTFIDKQPTELVSVFQTPPKADKNISKSTVKKTVRKKRLHWKALDASKVSQDSLWAARDNDIKLDEDEFNRLFVESNDPTLSTPLKSTSSEPKKQRINIIDMKRAQNGGIALARIKPSFLEVRERVTSMDDEVFTSDQLIALSEYLPTEEEQRLLMSFNGDRDMLGQVEKYMLIMMELPSAGSRLDCMIYKKQFSLRLEECNTSLARIERASNDVFNDKLKKVLQYILNVGNKLNDSEAHVGFSLDSLLKLQSSKAFDNKTTVLHYVVTLIHRNDEQCLRFPEELSGVNEASRTGLESVSTDHHELRGGLDRALKVLMSIKETNQAKPSETITKFLTNAMIVVDLLEENIKQIKIKYDGVLKYFGEDPSMSSNYFFSTLSKFIREFIVVRDKVERDRKLEAKNALRDSRKELTRSTSTRSFDSNENLRSQNVTYEHIDELKSNSLSKI